jgi:hypothetical protein
VGCDEMSWDEGCSAADAVSVECSKGCSSRVGERGRDVRF